jgi:hypothetical protein
VPEWRGSQLPRRDLSVPGRHIAGSEAKRPVIPIHSGH